MRTLPCLALCAGLAGLASCKVGPNFQTPNEPVPDRYAEAGVSAPAADPAQFWWQEFHDDELNKLEESVIAGNLDLQAAFLRIVEARAQVQSARSQGLPSLNASASYNREQLGACRNLEIPACPDRRCRLCAAGPDQLDREAGESVSVGFRCLLGARSVRQGAQGRRSRGCAGVGRSGGAQ